jgi:hypothetical protein
VEAGENGGQSVSSKITQTITIEQIESKLKRFPKTSQRFVFSFYS